LNPDKAHADFLAKEQDPPDFEYIDPKLGFNVTDVINGRRPRPTKPEIAKKRQARDEKGVMEYLKKYSVEGSTQVPSSKVLIKTLLAPQVATYSGSSKFKKAFSNYIIRNSAGDGLNSTYGHSKSTQILQSPAITSRKGNFFTTADAKPNYS
jgi:hypothetical protein